MIFNKNVQTV